MRLPESVPRPNLPEAFSDWLGHMDFEDAESVTRWVASMLRDVRVSFQRLVGPESAFEDMLQHVLLATVRSSFTIRDDRWEGSLRAWVVRAGKHYCLQALEPHKRLQQPANPNDDEAAVDLPDHRAPCETVESREARRLFLLTLADMKKPRDRSVILLKFCGKTRQWMANAYGKTVAVIDNWVHHARLALRQSWIKLHGIDSWRDHFPDDEQDRDGPEGRDGHDFPNDEQDRDPGDEGHERGIGD